MSNDSNTQEIRRIISATLNIENSAGWHITSEDPEKNLYMIHHRPEANVLEYGHIRGIVVDTEVKNIVAKSYVHTPTVVTDKLSINDNKLIIKDLLDQEYVLDPDTIKISRGYEGTLFNVFKHNGKVYRSTRKRLDASKSHWGKSKKFLDMYWELNGPKDEDMFSDKKYSPYCHTFIIVHPDVAVVSKGDIGKGYLIYLGSQKMWEESPYPEEDTDMELHVPECQKAEEFSMEKANSYLLTGDYEYQEAWKDFDKRMLPGEFVIIQQGNNLYRVESSSYNWRSQIRDNNNNLLHRFYQLVDGSYIKYDTPEGKEYYDRLYPTFTPYDPESINEKIKKDESYYIWPQNNEQISKDLLLTKESRLFNIWLCLLNSVPIHKQKEVVTFHSQLYKKRGELISWIRQVGRHNAELSESNWSKRVINIIETARKYASGRKERGQNKNHKGEIQTFKSMIDYAIKNLVMKEKGHSLYRLVREMDNWKKEQSK